MRYIKYALVIFGVFLSGCLFDKEIKAQQENAFDIAGTYKATEDSEVQLSFTITNQDGNHDIFVQFNRTSPLTNQEKEFLSELARVHDVSVDTLITQPFPSTFGGHNSFSKGGDNISTDFGKTSDFYVCSDNLREYESKKFVGEGVKKVKLQIFYCFSGIIKKENKDLIEKGKVSLEAFPIYDLMSKKGKLYEEVGGGLSKSLKLNYRAEKQ